MAKFNKIEINRKIAKALSGGTRLPSGTKAAIAEDFQEKKDRFIDEFNNHEISQEIAQGASSSNVSNTLPDGYGNLFSFIGFEEGSTPVSDVSSFLQQNVRLMSRTESTVKKVTESTITLEVSQNVRIPTQQELESVSPMPWEPRSWLFAIERGISGFGNYMFNLSLWFRTSRSGTAVQLKNQIRSGKYIPTSYFSKILRNFKNSLRSRF